MMHDAQSTRGKEIFLSQFVINSSQALVQSSYKQSDFGGDIV